MASWPRCSAAACRCLRSLAVLRDQSSNKNLKADPRRGPSPRRGRLDAGRRDGPLSAGLQRDGRQHGPRRRRRRLPGRRPGTRRLRSPSSRKTSRAARSARWPIRCFSASAGTIVVTVLIVFFVPKFAVMFERLRERGELPLGDRCAAVDQRHLAQLRHVRACWPRSSPASGSTCGCKTRRRPPQWRDLIKLKLPVAGPIFLSFAVARFCRVLGTLLHNGVPILKALEISRDAAGNRVLSRGDRQGFGEHLRRAVAGRPLGRQRAFPQNGGRNDRRGRRIEHARQRAGRPGRRPGKPHQRGSST